MDEQGTVQGTPQEPEQGGAFDSIAERLQELRDLRKQLEGTGRYVLLPTEALIKRAQVYFDQYAPDVLRLLENSGINKTDADAVVQDYCNALLGGSYQLTLPLRKQADVVNTVKPWRVFLTERYALNLLFGVYFYNTQATRDYITGFKLADGNMETVKVRHENGKTIKERETTKVDVDAQKFLFLEQVVNRIKSGTVPMLAGAYNWIRRAKVEQDGELLDIVEPSDFLGVAPDHTNKYFAYVEVFAGVDEYVNYYYIAKYALKATPDELKEIDFPPIFKEFERAQEYAENLSKQRYDKMQSTAAEFEKMIAADTVEETERAKQELKSDTPEQGETVRIPETFALLGSRDVYASVDGTPQMGKGILPIQAFITDYMKRHNLTEQVTPRTVEKVIEGVNLLQRLYNVKPVGGQYKFETNITEFSELIGYTDANQTEKLEIMRALQVLDGLFLAVWRSDGLKAVRVFTIQEIGLSGVYTGKLTLQVNADVMKGRPNLISYKDFNAIRKQAKGQAENHFRYQILSKGQKEENALLNEVFGYDTLLKEIQLSGGTVEDIERAKKNISGHKSRDKRRIAKWFEEYKQRGWILWYTYTRNGKGEYIYKWQRGNIPQDGTTLTPEEQTANA